MDPNIKVEMYRSSTGRVYKIVQDSTMIVKKVLEDEELAHTMDYEPVVGTQPMPGDMVRFREPIPKDLIFRCQFLDRKHQKELARAI